MLDSDTILQRPLDGIFDDPGANIVNILQNFTHLDDEGMLPSQYLLASMGKMPGQTINILLTRTTSTRTAMGGSVPVSSY